ncbi:MAG: peptidoglycan DD-metalloendopeptidase family protein [Acidimicrobiales bacterium]
MLLALATTAPASAEHGRKKGEELQKQRNAVDAQLDLAKASDARVAAELRRLAADVRGQNTRVASAQQAEAASRARISANEADIAALTQKIERSRAGLRDRAVAAYMQPGVAPFSAMTDAPDVVEASRRVALLRAVQQNGNEISDELDAARKDRDGARAALAEVVAQAEARRSYERGELAQLEAVRRAQQNVQAELDRRIADLQAESRELAAQQAVIEQILRDEAAAAARAEALARQRAAKAAAAAQAVARGAPTVLQRAGASAQGFIWPLRGRISSEYGPRWGGFHSGIDIAQSAGAPIVAAKDGVVAFAGWMDGYGNFVLVDHGGGYVTGYAHNSKLAASRGDTVDQGQAIAYVGSTGRSTGNHLHYEVRVDGKPQNPRGYLP